MWQLNKHKRKVITKNLIALKLNQEPKNYSFNKNISNLEILKLKEKLLEDKTIFFEPRTS